MEFDERRLRQMIIDEMYNYLAGMRAIRGPMKDEMNMQMHHYFARQGVPEAMEVVGLKAEDDIRVDLSDEPDDETKGWGEVLSDVGQLAEKISKEDLCNMVRDSLRETRLKFPS